MLLPLWYSHVSHVTHWSCDLVICKQSFISILARTMVTNFSKVWLKLSWPQPSSYVTHLSCHTLYLKKSASPVSKRQWPLNLVRLWVWVKWPHLLFPVTCWESDNVLFKKCNVSSNARLQNSAGDIKHRKTHKSKAFSVIQKILTFDSHHYTPL